MLSSRVSDTIIQIKDRPPSSGVNFDWSTNLQFGKWATRHLTGPGNSGAFNFSVFKALLNALHCGDKFMVKSLLKAPPPPTEVDNNEEQQMTWTIWINFLPLSHGGSTWNLASVGPVVSEKIFENRHTHKHTHFCTPKHNSWELFQMKQWGKAKHYIFVGGGRGGGGAVFFFFFFFFQSTPVSFCENLFIIFCRWWSSSKMQFVQMGSVGMKKSSDFQKRALQKNKMSYASAMVVALTDKLTL